MNDPLAKTAETKVSFKTRVRSWWDRHGLKVNILGFFLLFFAIYLSSSMFVVVGAGEAGVLFRKFGEGTETRKVYGEGMHLVAPWNTMTIYNLRLQQNENSFDVISKDGLTIGVTVSVRFRPKLETLGLLHQEVGPNYIETIVKPEVHSLVRSIFGQYTPEELYTTKRSVVQNVLESALGEIGERYIVLDDLLVKAIILPPNIKEAIENKLRQQQASLEMIFRLEREHKEAERKLVEAEGIRQYQTVISQGITERSLRYHGIEATLELAKSPNAKVVVIGGRDGLPLILDMKEGSSKDWAKEIPAKDSLTTTNSTQVVHPKP